MDGNSTTETSPATSHDVTGTSDKPTIIGRYHGVKITLEPDTIDLAKPYYYAIAEYPRDPDKVSIETGGRESDPFVKLEQVKLYLDLEIDFERSEKIRKDGRPFEILAHQDLTDWDAPEVTICHVFSPRQAIIMMSKLQCDYCDLTLQVKLDVKAQTNVIDQDESIPSPEDLKSDRYEIERLANHAWNVWTDLTDDWT